MSTLVFLEHHGGELLKGSLGVLAKAATLGDDVVALVAGSGVRDAAFPSTPSEPFCSSPS